MPLLTPNLDDRKFQDIVDEAKRLIPHYCPTWTDHNVSDPGVTLIELFAWMVEMLLYRVNRVPEKNYIAFMELMGLKLQAPAAARTVLTFWLAAPPVEPVIIPGGTEVSTVQTAAEPPVSFHTDAELVVRPPYTVACLTSPDERSYEDQTERLRLPAENFLAFNKTPRPGNAFYLCDTSDLSNNILSLLIDCSIEGIGVNPVSPPLAWEAWCHDGWTELELERDDTGGLNKQGQVILYLPPRMAKRDIAGRQGFWVRCRHTPPQPGQPTYSASPKIQAITPATLGGMASATHASVFVGQVLGRSDGKPGQSFRLEYAPVLPRRAGEVVEVQSEGGEWEPWQEREQFGGSVPRDTHFVLDSVSGEVRFGPAIREPDGSERQYGAIPPRGRLIRFARYRSGGGSMGNVGTRTLTVLKTTIPYVDRVLNRRPAVGGVDAESLEHAKLRAPQELRTSQRAVTAEDYEYLARQASAGVARASCVQPRALDDPNSPAAGTVQVLLVPAVSTPAARLLPEQLVLPAEMVQEVHAYLDERRLLTSVLSIDEPEYQWVNVEVRIKARPEANLESVRAAAAERLYRFLNPLAGGVAGDGWPFGRDLYIAEVYTVLQNTPGIVYIEQVSMTIDGTSEAVSHIALPANGLIASGEHRITVV